MSDYFKQNLWKIFFGTNTTGICMCCNKEQITIVNHHKGHITAKSKSGKYNIINIRPICANCNTSMNNQNLEEYMTKHNYIKQKNWLNFWKKENYENVIYTLASSELILLTSMYNISINNINKTKRNNYINEIIKSQQFHILDLYEILNEFIDISKGYLVCIPYLNATIFEFDIIFPTIEFDRGYDINNCHKSKIIHSPYNALLNMETIVRNIPNCKKILYNGRITYEYSATTLKKYFDSVEYEYELDTLVRNLHNFKQEVANKCKLFSRQYKVEYDNIVFDGVCPIHYTSDKLLQLLNDCICGQINFSVQINNKIINNQQ